MGKSVTSVRGKGGERMELSGGQVSFRTGGQTHVMRAGDAVEFEVMNAEDARAFASGTPENVRGLWPYNGMPSAQGKSAYLVARDATQRWVMEISKNQAPNAVKFAFSVLPAQSREEEEEEIKLYAAIQTPLGGVFTIGAIACLIGAYFALGQFRQPLIALLLAGASIFMYIRIK